MKILILAVTTLNFVTYFPYNGSQEIHSKRKQHFSANPPLSNYTASNTSSILKTEENSPTEDLSSYSAPLEGIVKITGSPSEGNRLEMIQENLHNFPPSGNDVLHRLLTNWTLVGFAYAKGTVDNPTMEDSPKSNASPSYDAIQDKSSVSSFAASSQITQRRRRKSLSRESSISLPVSLTHYQGRMELPDVADLDTDSEITESHEHFPSWFASDSATNMQNSMENFIALADEGPIDTSSENSFLRTATTINEEAEQEDVIFIDSTAPIEKGIFTPRRHFGSLIDREMSSEEKSTFYTEVESESEEDVFQDTEDIPSSDNLNHFELGYNSFEMDGFLDSNTANSLSKLIIIPCTEITISDRDLYVPEEENVDTLYVTSPINKKINFKPMATKTKFNSLDVSSGIKKNIDIGDVEVSTPSNSVHQIERMGYSRPLNTYYDDISKPIIIAMKDLKDPYVTWETVKNKQLSSTMDNGDIIDLRNGYPMPTDISAKNTDRPANKRTTARNEASNSFHVNIGIINNNLNNEKEKVKLDFPSIIADSPIKKYNIKINDFETLKRKLSDLGSASGSQSMKNEEETVFIADSSDPFSPPQETNSVKKLYWAAIMAQKTYSPNNITTAASNIGMISGSHDDENMLNSQRYETENSFEEGATLKYEADLQNEESIDSEEDGTLEKENINYYTNVLPMEEDYILKEDRRATTHYSMNPDAYGTITFRWTSQPRAGQAGFQHTENAVSKTLFGKLNPEVQRKMIATDTTSDSNHDELSSDTHYRMIQENVPSIYTFTRETVPESIKSDFSIPMRGDVNPDKAMKGRSRKNFIASFNLVNVTKMPPNATILFPYPSALESKEGNDNSGTSAPSVEDVRPVGLKFLLIPNQKISRTAAALGGNDRTSYSAEMSQVSEPTEEHWTSIDQDWKVIDDPSAAEPFSQGSAVPVEGLMFFPENIINVADIHTTEYGENSGDPDSMTFSSDIATQAATHSKRGINQDAEFVSHHVQQTAASPPAEERATLRNEGRPFSSNDNTVVEEKFYISGDNIPVNLEELNAMKATPLLLNPVVASTQEEGLGNPGETFYPGSTGSTAQLRQVQARDSVPLGSLDQQSTDSSTNDSHLPSKVAFSFLGFTKNKNSKSDPALIIEEATTKMSDNSFIPDDLLALSDTEVPSTDDATFIEDLNNILDGEKGIVSVKWNDMIQYGAIPFMENSSAELHMEPEVRENKGNYMDLTTIGLDENTLEFPSNENTFYALEEERSPTIRKPTIMQGVLHRRIGSPVPFPSTHVTENPSKENVVESKSEQKYSAWFLRGANSDSGYIDTSVQYLPAPFYNKPSRLMTTHFLTNQNGKFSTKISDGFTLKGNSISRREGEDTENINTSDAEPVTAEIERREFPSKISVPTMKLTKVIGREQLPRKGLSATAFNAPWEANGTMPPKSKYNENKASREESYNSRDITIPSYPGSINTESEFPFVYEDSEAKFLKESSALSHIKKTNTSPRITSLSSAETNEWRGVMSHEENARSGEPLILPTTENINLIPEDIAKHSVLMSDKPLSDYSELESVPTDIIEYIDHIGETNNQYNQVIRCQKGLNHLTFTSTSPHQASANVIRNSINSDADSSSTMKSENTSEMTHSQDSSIPFAEFAVITNDGFPFLDDSEDLSGMAFLPFSPVNTMNVMEDALILDTDSSYEGDSVLSGEDNNRTRGSQAQQSSEKHGDIPDVSTEYLETSGQMTSDFLTNTPAAWSDILETKTGYINFINDENVFTADSNVHFSPPQAKNPVKKHSWAAIMARKTYLPSNTTTTKVGMTAGSHDAENTLKSPRYEMGNSFEDEAVLNYDAALQHEETTGSEEDKTLEKENIKDYIAVVPMEYDYSLKEDRLATTHYSTNPNVYETTTFRGMMPPRAGQPGFENVVSKHWLGKLKPEVQRKMIARNTNSDSNYDKLFSDTTYRAIQENIPNNYAFNQETVPEFIRSNSSIPIRNKINPGKAVKDRRKETLIASFNLVNVTKMPPSDTILFPYPSALEFKEGNDNSGTSAPSVENVHSVGLKSLLIPNQKISRTAAALGGNDRTSYSAVMSQVSEPTEEHWTSIDQDWKVTDDPSAADPFSQGSAVPLEDLMFIPENIINVADIHTSEYGDNSGDTDSMAFSSDTAPQAATHSKRGINQAAGFVSHHVQQTAASPPAEERATLGNEGRPFSSKDKAVVEEKVYISADNIPVNLQELNATKATPLLPNPVVASAQQKGNCLENPGEKFYLGSTLSTKKLTQVQARDSLPLGNLDQTSTDSSTKGSHFPMKMVFSTPGFMENKRSKLLTTESIIFIPEDLIKNFVIMGDRPLSDALELEPEASGTTVFMDLVNEPDNQANQDVRFQTGLKHLMLKSRFPHTASVNVIRNSINNAESSSTMKRENMSEMTHSQDSSIPLAEFDVITNDGFSFADDSEDVGDMASLPFSPINTMQTMEDAIILDTGSSNEGESVLPGEVSNQFKGSLALKSSAKRGILSDAFARYYESSSPLTSESLTYTSPPWSETLETKTDYIDVINDEGAVFNADSFVPFNLPQARNPVKKLSLASIVAQKTYLPNKTTIRASKISTKAVLNDAENTLNSPRYESENSADEDTELNYDLQNKESFKSEEDKIFEEENTKDDIYVVPMEDDYILKEDRLATTHYSNNPGAYDTTTFRETLQPRGDQAGFENTENVVSKPQLGKLNPQVQRKMIATNRKGDSNHDELSSDNTYRTIKENIPSNYTFIPENVKFIRNDYSIPIRGNVNAGNAMKDRSKETLIASFNLVNVTKMPPNVTILFPYPSALESKEGNDNSGTSAPSVGDVRPVGLKFLLIPNQKISRTAIALGGNDRTSYSAVMSQVSEPTEEHWTSIDQDWKVTDDPSAAEPFSQGSAVPVEGLMFFPENIINVADIHTTEYGDNSGDPDSMAFSSDTAPQAATHSKRGINQAAEFVSHHVQQTAASPPAEERATSGNEGRPFSSNDKAVVEEKNFISADNIPVNLEELNAMKATSILPNPVVASAQQEGLENSGETFYPDSTESTEQLRQVQARDSLPLGNLGQMNTDSSSKSSHFPMKMAFSSPGFMENKSSKLLTTESIIFIPEDLIKNFVIMDDHPLSDASELEPEASGTTVFMDLINEPDNQANQDVRFQIGLKHLMLKSRFPHKASANVIRDSINNNMDSSSTIENENMSEMTHSQDSSIPLTEFDVITNDGFFFLDDCEDLGDMASLPFSLMNTIHTMEDVHILDTDGSYEGESLLPEEDNNRIKVSRSLKSSAEKGVFSDASTGYHVTSDPLTSDFLTNNPAPWSDTFETKTDYIDVINDEGAGFNADSFVAFNLPPSGNSVKKFSSASFMAQKTYLPNKTTIRASNISTTATSNDAKNTLHRPRYESENAVVEDAKLNYEANLQKKESIKSEEDDTVEEKNINYYIYIAPMEDGYILKEDRLATTHYSNNPDAYDTKTFRETLQPRAGQPGLKNTENMVSKPQLGKLNPEVQRKMIARNTNSDSNHDERFSDTTYRMMQENIPIIYTFTPETVPEFIRSDSSIPVRGDVKPHKTVKDRSKETLIASFNLVNVTKMPPSDTILFPYPSALESKEGNDNSGTSAPSVEDVRPVGLKFLLIPNQKISRTAAALGGNDRTSYSAEMSQVSEPTEEHWTSIDQDWKVIDDPSAADPFSQGSAVPVEGLMFLPENIINVADIHTSEYGDNSGDPDSMTFSSDIATQAATHSKRGINQAAEFGSHHVQQTAASPPAEERATSGNEGRPFSSNDKAVVEEKNFISVDNIPVNLEELNAMKATSLLPNPVVASTQEEGLGNPGETFYPGSTGSTEQLARLQARDSLAFLNLDQPSTDSSTKGSHLPMKMAFSPPGFMENKSSKLLTTERIILIPEDLIKNFVIMGDKPLSDASELEPELSDIIAFMNLINESDNQDSQVICLQTG